MMYKIDMGLHMFTCKHTYVDKHMYVGHMQTLLVFI